MRMMRTRAGLRLESGHGSGLGDRHTRNQDRNQQTVVALHIRDRWWVKVNAGGIKLAHDLLKAGIHSVRETPRTHRGLRGNTHSRYRSKVAFLEKGIFPIDILLMLPSMGEELVLVKVILRWQ